MISPHPTADQNTVVEFVASSVIPVTIVVAVDWVNPNKQKSLCL